MGQSIMKFASGLIFSNPTNYNAIESTLELDRLWSAFSTEIGDISPEGRGEERKDKELEAIIRDCYDKVIKDIQEKLDPKKDSQDKEFNFGDFYEAISKTIAEINKKLNTTQFRIPEKENVKGVYDKHYHGKTTPVKKEEFEKMLQDVIIRSGITGFESIKDLFLFIFGIPAAALFIKQGVAPNAITNDVFIPSVTSATVYLLAKLHKI